MLADVNGDGKADIVGFGDSKVFVSLSNGNGFDEAKGYSIGFTEGWTDFDKYPRLAGAVKGNGLDKVVGFGDAKIFVSSMSC
jgi:hypothetical protein